MFFYLFVSAQIDDDLHTTIIIYDGDVTGTVTVTDKHNLKMFSFYFGT